jgi:hypothetical protein
MTALLNEKEKREGELEVPEKSLQLSILITEELVKLNF